MLLRYQKNFLCLVDFQWDIFCEPSVHVLLSILSKSSRYLEVELKASIMSSRKSLARDFMKCHCTMSLVMRKLAFCICENKDADQLRGNREADQRLCFRYTDSTIPLLPKSEISSL